MTRRVEHILLESRLARELILRQQQQQLRGNGVLLTEEQQRLLQMQYATCDYEKAGDLLDRYCRYI